MTLGYQAANGWRADAAGSVFDEDRLNGTPAVMNSTASRSLSVDVAGGLGGGLLSLRGFGGTQDYLQTFSAVNATRTGESLNRIQRVPTEVVGFGAQWVLPIGRHAVLVGAERRHIDGTTIETPFSATGSELPTTTAGGKQQLGSGFGQATLNVSDRLTVVGAAQALFWHTESATTSYDKALKSFNPRGSFSFQMNDLVAVRGSAYRGFRAPTLNEFYRGFRIGNTQTNPNEALLPERLRGGDGGLLISYRARLGARHRLLEHSRRRDHEHHAFEHADTHHQAAGECRPGPGGRLRVRRGLAAAIGADGNAGDWHRAVTVYWHW